MPQDRVPRSDDDRLRQLDEQMELLRRAAAGFDEGAEVEAKNLATRIRVLVYDSGNGVSLLKQLRIKDRLEFIDTAPDLQSWNISTDFALTAIEMTAGRPSPGTRYVPNLGEIPKEMVGRRLPFKRWWHKNVVKDDQGRYFTRERLVLAVAHTDGSAHVDDTMERAYEALSRNNSLGWISQTESSPSRPLGDPVPASIRQIAYELEETIRTQAPALLGLTEV